MGISAVLRPRAGQHGRQALWFSDARVALRLGLIVVTVSTFVVVYEEPTLKRTYGASYETYTAAVRRWIPRARPWTGPKC